MTNVLLIDEEFRCVLSLNFAINSIYAKESMIFILQVLMRFLLSSDLATLFTGRTMEIKSIPIFI